MAKSVDNKIITFRTAFWIHRKYLEIYLFHWQLRIWCELHDVFKLNRRISFGVLVAELAHKCIAQFHTAQMSLKFFVNLLRSLKLHGRNMRVHLQHSTINLDNLMAQQDKVMSMCWVTSFNGCHSCANAHTDTGKHTHSRCRHQNYLWFIAKVYWFQCKVHRCDKHSILYVRAIMVTDGVLRDNFSIGYKSISENWFRKFISDVELSFIHIVISSYRTFRIERQSVIFSGSSVKG